MVTKAIPNSPDTLEEFLSDKARAGEAFGTPAAAADFIEGYRKAANAKDPDLQEQVQELQEKGLLRFLSANGYEPRKGLRLPGDAGDPAPAMQGGDHMYRTLNLTHQERRQIAANGRGPGASEVGKFPNAGEWLRKVASTVPGAGTRIGEVSGATLKDMNTVAGGEGGFLVPEEFRAELLRVVLETSIVRPRARVIPMAGQTLRYPAIRDASHASTLYGGVDASWIAEAASLATNTQPSFIQIRLDAKKLTGYSIVSNELLQDSAIAMEALITSLFPEVIAYREDEAFIQGTGAGQPLGILNADALVSVAKETGQAATTLVWENLIKMYSRMLPASLGRGVWLCHNDVFPQLASLALNVGTGGSAVWLTNGAAGAPLTILGRPVIFSEKCKTLGTAGDIYFVDLSYYLIGDRQALTMAASPHVNFTTDEMTWRFVQRVDGRPWITVALTPRNGSNTVSPYVSLASRS